MVPLSWYLILSAVLFCLGVFGFLIKRNIITIFMSIELMLNAVNLTFVAFAHHWQRLKGQSLCLLCDGCGRRGSRRGTGHHHCCVPHARDTERRPGEPDETMNANLISG